MSREGDSRQGGLSAGKRFMVLLIAGIVFGMVFSERANGQSTFGSILGTVKDSSGQYVVGATVNLFNRGTVAKRSVDFGPNRRVFVSKSRAGGMRNSSWGQISNLFNLANDVPNTELDADACSYRATSEAARECLTKRGPETGRALFCVNATAISVWAHIGARAFPSARKPVN